MFLYCTVIPCKHINAKVRERKKDLNSWNLEKSFKRFPTKKYQIYVEKKIREKKAIKYRF